MDENSKIVDSGAVKPTTEDSALTNPNPNPNPNSDVAISTVSSTNNSSVNNDGGGGGGGGGNIASAVDGGPDGGGGPVRQSSRTPFTNLSQEDADLALARTLQEQERAYMMLTMNRGGVGYGRWETGIHFPDDDDEDDDFGDSHEHGYDEGEEEDGDDDEGNEEIVDDIENYDDEDEDEDEDEDDDEDAFDVHAHDDESGDSDGNDVDLDPSAYSDDEAYARALQDAEEREMAARLLAMAGLTEREIVDVEDHGGHSQDTWTSDPDELSYEELVALGDVVGTESRGLSADTIASLPSTNYSAQGKKETDTDTCVICRVEYEDGDPLTTLPCKHGYHSDCINNWLKIKKACPVCSAEVSTSTSGNS